MARELLAIRMSRPFAAKPAVNGVVKKCFAWFLQVDIYIHIKKVVKHVDCRQERLQNGLM